MDEGRFALACDAFLALMGPNSGWGWSGNFLAREPLLHILPGDQEAVTSTYHVVWHSAFAAPVLYFNHCDRRGRLVRVDTALVGQENSFLALSPLTRCAG